MTNVVELRIKINKFLMQSMPLVCLKASYHIILRKGKLQAVKSTSLQIGDIRLVQLDSVDFVKGLSPDQWTTLMVKVKALAELTHTNIFPEPKEE